MTIGLCRVVLYLPESGSLKSKRNLLASIVTRIRSKFNVSVSEIEDNELWQRATLGVAIVSNEARHANRVLSKVVDLVKADVRLSSLTILSK